MAQRDKYVKELMEKIFIFWSLPIIFLGLLSPNPSISQDKILIASKDVNFWLKELESRKPSSTKKLAKKSLKKSFVKSDNFKNKSDELSAPKKISVDFYKVDLHNVFRLLGQVSGKNIVVDEGVKGTLTLALDNVPWTFVLDVIKSLKGLSSIERNNTIMIYPKNKSVEWTGEKAGTGSLEAEPLEVKKEPTLVKDEVFETKIQVEGVLKRSKTPMNQIVQAQELIKKAASQERHGNELGAYETLRKAAKLWPDSFKLNEKLASMALKHGDLLAAYNYAKEALKIDPKSSEAAGIAAIALAQMERFEDARNYFEMAMAGKPTKDILWNYAVFLFSQGNYRQALRLINRIEARYQVEPEVIMLKAQCYEYLSKPKQAIVEYRTILASGRGISKDMVQFAQIRIRALSQGQISPTPNGR